MSVNQDTSGYIVDKKQGKIHTQNADLLSLLTENSSDSLISKADLIDTQRSDRSHRSSKTPLDANNNSHIEEDSESVGRQSQTPQLVSDRRNFPQPKPSALLPSARAPSTDIKEAGRSSSTSVYAVANPDILRASGLTPTQQNQYFPKYVSLKSRSQDAHLASIAVAEEEEATPTPTPTPTPRSNSVSAAPRSNSVSPTPRSNSVSPTPRSNSVSPTKESAPASLSASSKLAFIADSLEFTETDLEKHLTPLSPDPEATSRDQDPTPAQTPSVVVQENTFDKSLNHKEKVQVDKNLLQVPASKSSAKSKAHNPESLVFERDSLSSSASIEEIGRARKTADSADSSRSRVFVIRNESQNTMSGARNRKVYVESPAFTHEEEDEFRFVSSRVDDYQDMSDTYRQLDESTVEHKSKKKSSGKHVRYQDSDRFEDKNQLDLEDDARSVHRLSQGHDVTYKSALRNPNRQESVSSPVKSLVLPDKPSFDQGEIEELDRESKYQDVLKQRIDHSRQTLESDEIPKLPLSPDTDHDFMRDSLDMAGEIYQEGRGSAPRDSMELYQGQPNQSVAPRYGQMENTTWRNPPPQPFSAPPYEEEKEDVLGQFHRQNAVDGYASEPDYRIQQRRDDYPEPPSEPHHYPQEHQAYQKHPNGPAYQAHPQYYEASPQGQRDYPHQQQFPTSGYYDNGQGYPQRNPHISSFVPEDRIHQSYDSELSYRPPYNEYEQTNPNGGYMYYDDANGGPENGHYDNRPELAGGYSNQNRVDRYVNENVDPKMEMSSPGKLKYDYVTNNRFDYGRQPPKSYKQLRDIKNEEKSKLETFFIKPKVKPKHDAAGQSSARTVNSLEGAELYHPPRALNEKPASAEDLWAQRAAKLQQRSAGKQGSKKKTGSKLVKYPSDSGLSARLDPKVPLPRPAFLPQAVNSGPHSNYASPPHSFPSSPQRRPLELKPISQEVITSDGQRISVDVNLKLMSPPPAHHHSDGYLHRPQTYIQDVTDPVGQAGHQYPIMDYHNQQDYGENYSDAYSGVSNGQPGYDSMPKDTRQLGNAYPKIPPIPSSSESKDSHQQQSEANDGYVAQFRKQRDKKQQDEHPWYKVYNINDYRKMQKEVRLGTLGPDLDNDSFKDRMEKMQRQTHYARQVQERNKQEVTHRKPPSFPKPKDQDDIMNKRRLALEYAKNVPKPSVKVQPNPYNSYQVASQMVSTNPASGPLVRQQYKQQPVVDVIDLDKLQQRHEQDKQNVAKIRQNMDSVVAQNA